MSVRKDARQRLIFLPLTPAFVRVWTISLDAKLGKVLRAPRATSYSCENLFHQMHMGLIDLEPEYQRGESPSPSSQAIWIATHRAPSHHVLLSSTSLTDLHRRRRRMDYREAVSSDRLDPATLLYPTHSSLHLPR